MQFDCRRGVRAVLLLLFFAGIALPFLDQAHADAKDQLTDRNGVSVPLQQALSKERKRGPIYIAIPVAYVFGLGGERSPTYCSPTVRATNSSNLPIEELIVGIDYHTKAGSAGGSITRYANIKVGDQDAHYFYQLSVSDCRGITGTVAVVRCKYATGEDCAGDVRVIDYGTIPLRQKDR